MRKGFLLLAAISGFFCVALGAFGAHGLKSMTTPELITTFNIGVDYQFYHTFGLIALAFAGHWFKSKLIDWAAYMFIAGMMIFSGSLYLYAFTGTKWLGMITPLGGGCLLVGWALFAAVIWRSRMEETGL